MLATPIGHLRDITLRALDVLSAVDVVAAEDTRVTRYLLAHYGINAKIVSLREHNEARQAQTLVGTIQEGKSVALVTDAGTPGISDPGAIFVHKAREAGIKVVPIPGPSAAICALSILGWEKGQFLFYGFLPNKGGARQRVLSELEALPYPVVFYESPHRILDTMGDLVTCLGPVRRCVLFRELTKVFEETRAGTLAEIAAWVRQHEDHRRGEFVLIVEGAQKECAGLSREAERVLKLLCDKLPTKDAVRLAADITGHKRNELYELALNYKSAKIPEKVTESKNG